MEKLAKFCTEIKEAINDSNNLSLEEARRVVKNINDFLYTNYPGIGSIMELGEYREYFSDFHKFWKAHHMKILNCKIDDSKCEKVADALRSIYIKTEGSAFRELYDTCGLSKQDICRVRFLTANQDFRGSLDFTNLANKFKTDSSIFDEELIFEEPSEFVHKIGISSLSQNDKRITYAQTISKFLLDKGCSPYGLIDLYNRNIALLREAIIGCDGAGYGNKKTDMFLRDMVVLGVWDNVSGFEKIDVASDVNTIKVALRTGIIKTEIPLVSSFLDIFCYQYGYIESMNTLAWRRVWEIWNKKYPMECIESPCLIDYFVYKVIGKQFCKEILFEYECETHEHTFMWHNGRNKTCQFCLKNGIKRVKAQPIKKMIPCSSEEGYVSILETPYVMSLPEERKIKECPFKDICQENRNLQPPKSISILGQTGWFSAYARRDEGGGGLMA
ncbi:MAG: hypothetical protein IKG81_09095 [Bacteroidales bacterium]|nr:hypothetical protein [Bacteroidales bacterium]